MSVVSVQQPGSDLFKMETSSKNKSEINIWTRETDINTNASDSPLNSAKNLRKSFSASTLSTNSIKTSSDSASSISSVSKQSTQTDNSNKSFPLNPILVKDARARNFIVGSVNHQVSL